MQCFDFQCATLTVLEVVLMGVKVFVVIRNALVGVLKSTLRNTAMLVDTLDCKMELVLQVVHKAFLRLVLKT